MKWEALLAMLGLFILGAWLVWAPTRHHGLPEPRAGARIHELRVGPTRGGIEVLSEPGGAHSFRLLLRDGTATQPFTDAEFVERFGADLHQRVTRRAPNWAFRMLNITGWGSLLWVAVGLGGQALFFGRMAVQWVASERKGESVVPEIFWWFSLGGGAALFAYFVWRQDLVGVLGQTSGVVIYARNIRLIYKKRRREERRAERERQRLARAEALADPSGEPAVLEPWESDDSRQGPETPTETQ